MSLSKFLTTCPSQSQWLQTLFNNWTELLKGFEERRKAYILWWRLKTRKTDRMCFLLSYPLAWDQTDTGGQWLHIRQVKHWNHIVILASWTRTQSLGQPQLVDNIVKGKAKEKTQSLTSAAQISGWSLTYIRTEQIASSLPWREK